MKKVVATFTCRCTYTWSSMTAFAAPSPSGNTSNATITATSDQGNVIVSQNYKTEAEKKRLHRIWRQLRSIHLQAL